MNVKYRDANYRTEVEGERQSWTRGEDLDTRYRLKVT